MVSAVMSSSVAFLSLRLHQLTGDHFLEEWSDEGAGHHAIPTAGIYTMYFAGLANSAEVWATTTVTVR